LDSQNSLDKYKNKIKDLNSELASLQNLNNHLRDVNTKQEESITQLKKHIEEGVKSYKKLNVQFNEEKNNNKSIKEDYYLMKDKERDMVEKIYQKDEELNNLKIGMNSMSFYNDNINNDLDTKTEEISKLNLVNKDLQNNISNLTFKIHELKKQKEFDDSRLSQREAEILNLKAQNKILKDENERMRLQITQLDMKVYNLSYEINTLAGENQNLLNDIDKINKDKEDFMEYKYKIQKDSEVFIQKFKEKQVDLNELLASYKDVCVENEKIKGKLKLFIEENRLAYNHIQHQEEIFNKDKNLFTRHLLEKDEISKRLMLAENYNKEYLGQIALLNGAVKQLEYSNECLKKNLYSLNPEDNRMILEGDGKSKNKFGDKKVFQSDEISSKNLDKNIVSSKDTISSFNDNPLAGLASDIKEITNELSNNNKNVAMSYGSVNETEKDDGRKARMKKHNNEIKIEDENIQK